MARGKQLRQLVNSLRAECGMSMSPAAGEDALASLKEILSRTQEALWDEYDWPFATVYRSIPMQASSRFYDFPSDLPLEGIQKTMIQWGDTMHPFERGISFEDYSSYDSEAGETDQYPVKWDVRWTGTDEQIEVWPIPSQSDSTMWLEGKRSLPPLVDESDVAVLDDIMIVLYAAAEILARDKVADAAAKLDLAKARFYRVRGRAITPTGTMTVVGGGAQPDRRERLRAPRS
jgi:hypothetical protein